ncbi:MAG: hypothetical protein CM15mV88_390 [Caudoviricetes sp.]|nr:MAG: hypothetical protein CM15mV88_390 [Caudoviricetes sp.]
MNDFAKYVIQQARSNLTKGKKNFNKKLYNSLAFTPPLIDNTGIIIQFLMEDYGVYQDEGVKGKDPSQVSPNAKLKVNKHQTQDLDLEVALVEVRLIDFAKECLFC